MSINFRAELNDEQYNAVTAPDGPILIIAAAGTGKTRTLTYRVAYLVEHGIEPRRILLLTFTNKAAREMMDRARQLVGDSVSGLWGGTFHHMANRILRRHADAIGYQMDFSILDQDDARTLVRSCTEELGLKDKQFPKPDVLLGLFGLAVSQEKSLEELAGLRFMHHPVKPEAIVRVWDKYSQRKRDLNVMDFDDLLVNVLKLFKEHPAILEKYQERFQHILVDEYQDTNTIQAQMIDLLAAKYGNVLVVGDDFQSIYSWRGANFRNIMTFPERYEDTLVYKLQVNYRSVPEILYLANACIAGNPDQFQKELRPVREGYKKPFHVEVRDGQEQARYILQRIQSLKREGYKLNEMVVLYRSHFHSMELQMELARNRISYQITSGVRFFEQAHIKDVCTIPRLIHNPEDELAFLRLLCLFPRVGRRTAEKVWNALGRRFKVYSPEHRQLVHDKLPAGARATWALIDGIFVEAEDKSWKSESGEMMFQFVKAFYDRYAVDTFDNYQRRLEDIEELIQYSARFKSITDFLSEMALLSNLDAETDPGTGDEEQTMRLSTIHQAKGLEWKVVFIVWLADGMFPTSRAIDDPEGEAEERRLFYVASTRAKDELYLCVPELRRGRDGGVNFFSPSRFITELPEDVMQKEYAGFY